MGILELGVRGTAEHLEHGQQVHGSEKCMEH